MSRCGVLASAVLGAFVGLVFPVLGADDEDAELKAFNAEQDRTLLRGLPGVYFCVEGLQADANWAGVSEDQLTTDAELRLRIAGIRVLTSDQAMKTPGRSFLYLTVSVRTATPNLCAYWIELYLCEGVYLEREPTMFDLAKTWQAGGVLGWTSTSDLKPTIREHLRDMIDKFCNLYLAANPKEHTASQGQSASDVTSRQHQPATSPDKPLDEDDWLAQALAATAPATRDRTRESSRTGRTPPPDNSAHKALRIIDGDTIEIEMATGPLKVRIIGIDTPETVHPRRPPEPFAAEASKRAEELLLGKTIKIQYDPDPAHDTWGRYGRLLVYIQLPDGRDFGILMVAEGFAKAYTEYPFTRMSDYIEAEQKARAARIGIWAAPGTSSLGVRVAPPVAVDGSACSRIKRQRQAA